ncbi:TRAM domain-containing protein [Halomonas cupida]|uniref:TRAM domain-containing protein n=1 Tax=Halomonas cupida TaxID=44933 RepID=UPI003A8CB47F
MSTLGKRRPSRAASGGSGLSRKASGGREGVPRSVENGVAPGQVDIEGLAHDGRGIARTHDGKRVFVDGALPGERVAIAVHRSRGRYDEAHVSDVVAASPLRVTPPCSHAGRCGGCDLQHMDVDAQRRHKSGVLRELLQRQGIEFSGDVEVLATRNQHYRRRARLGVRVDAEGRIHLGFRARNSQRLVAVEHCTILVPELAALLPALGQLLDGLEAPRHVGHIELLYSDQGPSLVIRQLRRHHADQQRWQQWAQQRQLRLAQWVGREQPTLEWLWPQQAPQLSVAVPGAPDDLTLLLEPQDFLQANDGVNRLMVATVLEWLGPGATTLLDLFAGLGNFSLPLARSGYRVTAVEGQADMVKRLAINAGRNQLEVDSRRANLHEDGEVAALFADLSTEVVVLDPPRDGAEAVCRALAEQMSVTRVLYIACDPATLARDAAYLLQGGFALKRVAMADLFVHTSHLESMLLFERK